MATKTITVTEDAYEALHGMKEENESFSEAILRISQKRSLKEFVGALSEESAEHLEHTIRGLRKEHAKSHDARIKRVTRAWEQ